MGELVPRAQALWASHPRLSRLLLGAAVVMAGKMLANFFGPRFPIKGCTAVVTGGTQGIGKLVIDRLLAKGAARIYCVDLTVPASSPDPRIVYRKMDVRDRAACRAFADEVGPAGVDILYLNAGIANSGDFLVAESDERSQLVMDVNATSLSWWCKAFIPHLQKRPTAQIVFMCSAAALVGSVRLSTYCASKAAAYAFAESLKLELRLLPNTRRIHVSVVNPYYIAGPSTALFKGTQTPLMWRWILPILRDTYVADQVVESIERYRHLVQMPRFVNIVPLIRVLPVPAMLAFYDVLGLAGTMDKFQGSDVFGQKPPPAK